MAGGATCPFWGDEDSSEAAKAEANREAPFLALASLWLLSYKGPCTFIKQLHAKWRPWGRVQLAKSHEALWTQAFNATG